MRGRAVNRITCVFLFASLFLAGCGQIPVNNGSRSTLSVWYLNSEGNGITEVRHTQKTEPGKDVTEELLSEIRTVPPDTNLQPLLDEGVLIRSVSLKDGILSLDFSKEYADMSRSREVLARGGIVRTLMQVEGVRGIKFLTEGEDAVSPSGNRLGIMSEDSFVEDSGKKVNAVKHMAINLYFTDVSGTKLKKEARSIYYTASKPIEWAIVERVIAGPKVEGNYATVPSNTVIISVTSDNGVCYVNLNQTFVTNALNTVPEIPIYSIVDSLVENSRDIKEVKISVEGDSNITFKQSMDLSHVFTANYTLVEGTEHET
ncbi:MAG: GerMN domain-containing protein [Lachnospiraceae bacterium]|nr:GerMN domain-containing protein [Lachnospiraceae bacterium]